MSTIFLTPESAMRKALELAALGAGFVEPNPMVGAVVVAPDGRCLGMGYHQRFGGPHAEVHALREAGELARGATLYVTLEPCCHHGKTPPCTDAVIAAGMRRVVVAVTDPFPAVAGKGIAQLRAAGIRVETGLGEHEALALTAPFRKLVLQQRPFITAKWAMSLDGKLAAHTGISKWISNSESRTIVHLIRGRMDGILVGIGTVLADDPLLTVRPPGARTPTRIILDSQARLPITSQLIQTISAAPVLVFASESAPVDRVTRIRDTGAEIICLPPDSKGHPDLLRILGELGARRMTNVLVEGGSDILGRFRDAQEIDEVHTFIAPKLIGGRDGFSPIGGQGVNSPEFGMPLIDPIVERIGNDIYVHGRIHSSKGSG
ncbi:MAG: riboflavin biosynthesis protein RibD [Planctomycetaceae bacterium]|nr:riboflavin biosynthesis protein RibD [Planctomycetaceae bacterium]